MEHLHSLFKRKTCSPFHAYRYVSYLNFKCDDEEATLKFAAVANCILISVAPTLFYGWIQLRSRTGAFGITQETRYVPSALQKSSGLKFSKSRTGSHVTYSCHHNSSRFTFPIFVHSWRFSILHSLQSITPYILTKDTNTFPQFEVKT